MRADEDEADPDDREDPNPEDMDDSDDPEVVDCPYCGQSISEEAEQCPHCENYISAEDSPRRTKWWILAGAILLVWGRHALTQNVEKGCFVVPKKRVHVQPKSWK